MTAPLDVAAARAAWEATELAGDYDLWNQEYALALWAARWAEPLLAHVEQLHRSIRRAMCDPAVVHPAYLQTILDEVTL